MYEIAKQVSVKKHNPIGTQADDGNNGSLHTSEPGHELD